MTITISIIKGFQSKSLEVEPEAKTTEKHCLLAHSPSLTQITFQHDPWPPVQGRHHLQWAGPSYVNHYSRKCPGDLPTGQLMEVFSRILNYCQESEDHVKGSPINQSIKPSSETWQNTDCGLQPAQPCSSKEDVRKHHHTCLFSLSIAALARQMEEWGDAIKTLWLTSWNYFLTRPLRFTEPPLSQGFCTWKPFLPEKFYATLDKIKYLPTIIEQFTFKKKLFGMHAILSFVKGEGKVAFEQDKHTC